MKYNFDNLYIGNCRHYFNNMVRGKDDPDYEYYYALLFFDGYKLININDKNTKYIFISEVHDEKDEIVNDIVYSIDHLSNYIDYENKKISDKTVNDKSSNLLKEKNRIKRYSYKKRNY